MIESSYFFNDNAEPHFAKPMGKLKTKCYFVIDECLSTSCSLAKILFLMHSTLLFIEASKMDCFKRSGFFRHPIRKLSERWLKVLTSDWQFFVWSVSKVFWTVNDYCSINEKTRIPMHTPNNQRRLVNDHTDRKN